MFLFNSVSSCYSDTKKSCAISSNGGKPSRSKNFQTKQFGMQEIKWVWEAIKLIKLQAKAHRGTFWRQERKQEVRISLGHHFKRKKEKKVKSLSRVQLFATPWTIANQAYTSIGFSRQGYWSGLPFPSPGDLPDPGVEPGSPALEADALTSEPPGKPQEYWNELSCPPPGDLPNPRIKLRSFILQADSLPSDPPGKPYHFKHYSNFVALNILLC